MKKCYLMNQSGTLLEWRLPSERADVIGYSSEYTKKLTNHTSKKAGFDTAGIA